MRLEALSGANCILTDKALIYSSLLVSMKYVEMTFPLGDTFCMSDSLGDASFTRATLIVSNFCLEPILYFFIQFSFELW